MFKVYGRDDGGCICLRISRSVLWRRRQRVQVVKCANRHRDHFIIIIIVMYIMYLCMSALMRKRGGRTQKERFFLCVFNAHGVLNEII